MYTYKCYFHPKDNSLQSCKGCKLPVCGGCFGPDGFCPECTKRRDSIHQLKQMRAARVPQRTATTGRLRLPHAVGSGPLNAASPAHAAAPRALQGGVVRSGQDAYMRSGPQAPSRPAQAAPSAAPQRPARTPSRPLQPIRDQFTEQPRPAAAARAPQAVPQPRRYNPANVAYKPVTPAVTAPKAAPATAGWATPFLVGLAVGAVIVIVGHFGFQHAAEAPEQATIRPAAATSLLGRFQGALEQSPGL